MPSASWRTRRSALLALLPLPAAAAPLTGAGPRLRVPFFAQPPEGCGAAAIAMVTAFWRPGAVDVSAIHARLHVPAERGIPARSLRAYFEQTGFKTAAIGGDWSALASELDAGHPLIAALEPVRGWKHYVVLTGYDPERRLIIWNDPAGRAGRLQHLGTFLRHWQRSGAWALLALPSSQR